MKRVLFSVLLLVVFFAFFSCGTSEKRSDKDSDRKESSSKDTGDKNDDDSKDEASSGLFDILKEGKKDKDKDSSTESGKEDNRSGSEDVKENGAGADRGSTDEGGSRKSDRHIEHRYYELVSVDGYTREDFQNNEELAYDYNVWAFVTYGTGVDVDFDYDEGYVQYTWNNLSPNAYSSAPVDNPSAVDSILDYTDFLNTGEMPSPYPVSVQYSDDTIVLTYVDGGAVEIYKYVGGARTVLLRRVAAAVRVISREIPLKRMRNLQVILPIRTN